MIKWHFKIQGLTREEAEQKVLSLGFSSEHETSRGWRKKLDAIIKEKSKPRHHKMHIIPSDTYFDIHEDDKKHKTLKTIAARERCRAILIELKK